MTDSQRSKYLEMMAHEELELISFNTRVIKLKHDLEHTEEDDEAGIMRIQQRAEELEQQFMAELAYAEYLKAYLQEKVNEERDS